MPNLIVKNYVTIQTNERRLSRRLFAVSKPSEWVDPFGFDTPKNSLGLLNRHYAE